ncbi:hypothetical protein GCM10027074_04000 [Streptomyces deserti]
MPSGQLTVLQITVWPPHLRGAAPHRLHRPGITVRARNGNPALARIPAPVGFASGKGKVKEPDEQGSRPSKAPQA